MRIREGKYENLCLIYALRELDPLIFSIFFRAHLPRPHRRDRVPIGGINHISTRHSRPSLLKIVPGIRKTRYAGDYKRLTFVSFL